MKKIIITLPLALLIFGCDYSRNVYALNILNGYFEEDIYGYYPVIFLDGTSDGTRAMLPYIQTRIINGIPRQVYTEGFPFWDREAPKGVSRYDLKSSGFGVALVRHVNFYQSLNKECFLFSYTNEELRRLQIDAGYRLGRKDVVFVIMGDGLLVMSMKEFNQTRDARIPHPFDPSLCRTENNRASQ
jgi:hypothetical protein